MPQTVLLLLCIGALFLRVPSVFAPLWSLDEAVSACVANAIIEGGIPYRDAIDHRGLVTYYAYALIFFLTGQNTMVAVHVGLCLLIACVGWLLYLCVGMISHKTTGLLTALMLFLLSFGLFGAKDLAAAHTEYFVMLFSVVGVYCFVRHLLHPEQRWLLFVSGMSYGLAFFAKQPALVDIFAVVCFVCAQALFKKTTWKHAIQRLSILLSGFLTILVSVLGFFFWRDGLQDFVFYFWTYNTKYYITTAGFTERFNIGLDFFRYLFQYFPVFAICFLSGEVYIVLRFIHANGQKNDHNHDPQLLFAIWAIGALTVPILSGRIPSFGHYYIQLLPALSVVCGIAAHDFMQAFLSWFSSPPDHQNRMPQRILVGLGLVLCLLVFLVPMTLLLSQRFSASFPRHASNPFEQEAVKYIQEQTAPADSIFVWGFFPELYVLANRRPASRYTFTNVLTGFIPWEHMEPEYDTSSTIVPGTWDILMEELYTNKPVLIIDTSPGQYRGYGKYPPQKFPPLHDFLNTYYEVAHEIVSDTKLVALRIFKRRTG